jgi:hypothetical protein
MLLDFHQRNTVLQIVEALEWKNYRQEKKTANLILNENPLAIFEMLRKSIRFFINGKVWIKNKAYSLSLQYYIEAYARQFWNFLFCLPYLQYEKLTTPINLIQTLCVFQYLKK